MEGLEKEGRVFKGLASAEDALKLSSRILRELLRGKLVEAPSEVSVDRAYYLVACRHVKTWQCNPPFPRANLDGCAVSHKHVDKGSVLRVSGRVRPGGEPPVLSDPKSACIWVDTGAPLPIGADSIVPLEELSIASGSVTILRNPEPWRGVSMPCSDAPPGNTVTAPGDPITPEVIASLRSMGLSAVEAGRRLKACIASIGDELEDPPLCVEKGVVCESNRAAIKARLSSAGIEVDDLGIWRDQPGVVERIASEARNNECDFLVTSGGSSVGLSDYTPASGGGIVFRGVSIRPGRPTAMSIIYGMPVFTLPGNPRSSATSLDLLVVPSLLHARLPVSTHLEVDAVLLGGIPGGKRLQHVPLALVSCGERVYAIPVAVESFMVMSWALTDGYATVSPGSGLEPGSHIRVHATRGPRELVVLDFTESSEIFGNKYPVIKTPPATRVSDLTIIDTQCQGIKAIVPSTMEETLIQAGAKIEGRASEEIALVTRTKHQSITGLDYIAVPSIVDPFKHTLFEPVQHVATGETVVTPGFSSALALAVHGYVSRAIVKKRAVEQLKDLETRYETRLNVSLISL